MANSGAREVRGHGFRGLPRRNDYKRMNSFIHSKKEDIGMREELYSAGPLNGLTPIAQDFEPT